ncbi:MAG TPA: site-specific integrase [Pseudolabrys sp.]|nr:site-specific integrase [Pseudolabrys sp.]
MAVRKRTWTNKNGSTSERWFCHYRLPDGKRRAESFATRKEAKDRDAKIHGELAEGRHVAIDRNTTIKEAGEHWIRDREAARVRPVTLKQYRSHLAKHIVPAIGDMRLGKLTPGDVTAFRDRLLSKLKPAMASKVWVSFGSLLRASRVGHLTDGIALSAPAAAELQAGVDLPTLAELPRIVTVAKPGRERALVMLLAFCGLRSGELRALRWSDVAGGVVSVNRGVDPAGNFHAPKSRRSVRKLTLPEKAAPHLLAWRAASPHSRDTDLVFPNTGEVRPGEVRAHKLFDDEIRALQKRAGVTVDGTLTGAAKYSGLHVFRHWFASWALAPAPDGLGKDLSEVSRMMGHSSQAITDSRYAHWFHGRADGAFVIGSSRMLAGL